MFQPKLYWENNIVQSALYIFHIEMNIMQIVDFTIYIVKIQFVSLLPKFFV